MIDSCHCYDRSYPKFKQFARTSARVQVQQPQTFSATCAIPRPCSNRFGNFPDFSLINDKTVRAKNIEKASDRHLLNAMTLFSEFFSKPETETFRTIKRVVLN